VAEECRLGPYYWCTVSDFRKRYEQHCEEMGADPLTAKALTMRLTTEFAVTSGKAGKGLRIYRGIELVAQAEEQP
jgi:putative DNA primase/helicase